MKRILVALALAFLAFTASGAPPPALAATTVSSEAELRAALASGNANITVTSPITVTGTLEVTAGTASIDGARLTSAPGVDSMFTVSGRATLTLTNANLDGALNGRLIHVADGSTVTISDSTIKSGSTQSLGKKIVDGANKQVYSGGAIYADRSTLNLTNVTFKDNATKTDTPMQAPGREPVISADGGAIHASASTVNITGGTFTNNYTGGMQSGSHYGEGGAIKLESSIIKINESGIARTVFYGNHNYQTNSNKGGLQGGALEITGSEALINRADFTVLGGFDTGGAIKFERSGRADAHCVVSDSTFKLQGGSLPTAPVASTYFGTSGGAIMTEGSYLTVRGSDFKMVGSGGVSAPTKDTAPKVAFAGGHIDVVGTGEFNLESSTLSGNGTDWNAPWRESAKYGGALAYENGCSVKSHITNTRFSGFTTAHVGAHIAVGHRVGSEPSDGLGETAVDLRMEGVTLSSGNAYSFDAKSAGAGMYIADGSKVVISGGAIEWMDANYGGAIFNLGETTLINNAKIQYNSTTYMAAGIFNNGYLNVHEATFQDNAKKTNDAFFAGGWHAFSKNEESGGAIYAKRDVIIGSGARFSSAVKNDVRVIEGSSAVILSGPRTAQLNISISEVESAGGTTQFGRLFDEPAHRHVGYLVARGLTAADATAGFWPAGADTSYMPTAADAASAHYVSHTVDASKVAAFGDANSPALWDYVYDPEAKTVVLGQRARMIYHTNHELATIAGSEPDTDPAGQKCAQTYTFYGTGTVSIADEPVAHLVELSETPLLTVGGSRYVFMGWYEPAAKGEPILKDGYTARPYDFTRKAFSAAWNASGAEITDILSTQAANTLHVYAVYSPTQTVNVAKTWKGLEGDGKHTASFTLSGGDAPVPFTIEGDGSKSFADLPTRDKQGNRRTYTVAEQGVSDGKVVIDGLTFTVSMTSSAADENGRAASFNFTNTRTMVRATGPLHIFQETTGDFANLDREFIVTVMLFLSDGDALPAGYAAVKTDASASSTSAVQEAGGAAHTFKTTLAKGDSLDFDDLPEGTTYTVSEEAVDGYIASAAVSTVGAQTETIAGATGEGVTASYADASDIAAGVTRNAIIAAASATGAESPNKVLLTSAMADTPFTGIGLPDEPARIIVAAGAFALAAAAVGAIIRRS